MKTLLFGLCHRDECLLLAFGFENRSLFRGFILEDGCGARGISRFDDGGFELSFFPLYFLLLNGDLLLCADTFNADLFSHDRLPRFGSGERARLLCRGALALDLGLILRFLDLEIAMRERDVGICVQLDLLPFLHGEAGL